MFALTLSSHGNQTALITEDGQQISYAALAAIADALYQPNVIAAKRGTLIAIECTNDLDTVASYLGALRNGYPAIMIDSALDASLKEALYAHYQVGACYKAGQWIRLHTSSPPVHHDTALMLSTSGSTGSAKLVRLSLANLQANAKAIQSYLQLDQHERPVTVLPIHYSYGLSILNSHLAAGSTILLTAQSITARGFWDMVKQHHATSLSGVPTTYQLLRQMRIERMQLPSLRTVTQAGGRIPDALRTWLIETCASHHWQCVIMYGQTEATARMAYLPPDRINDKPGAIGIAIPGGQFTLKDDEGKNITATNQTGNLHYTGANVMQGYARSKEELALGDCLQGQLDTGDLAWRDEEGFYYINGRRSRFLKIFGLRFNLDEIELQLQSDGYRAAVTGLDDRLMIALVGNHDPDALRQHVQQRYRIHHSALCVTQLDQLPLSSSGKIQYAELLTILSSQTGRLNDKR